eukprot:CAMPEP_0184988626 /NCGR_PEP_ID=MMETSP1098-20130426/24864_1 /TAXON_ID=89044 /ORGANISM="Spumella elongata, Strain CCAP 955/1" /LENGTH=50 /DNA_ID=CAMNT_0027513425 /DNA_START=196 /DNA_END=345 /DNA_ORIENTATION=-
MYGAGHSIISQVTLGYPGTLSLSPFSHIAQLSVARDHSPTTIGTPSASIS